jgi:predicted O-methyltransferase YrrM
MTTREATRLLTRATGADVIGDHGKSIADWAAVVTFGALQWPWLLRSLHGGSLADKHALLDRLELPYDALPYLGSWKADTGLLKLVVDHVLAEKPKVVVEFGTGASTLVIARALQKAGGGQLISFDQHGDFVEATRAWLEEFGLEADLRAAPLKPSPEGWPGLWYDHGALPRKIDMMLIDGPPWTVHPLVRGAAVSLFDRIAPGGTVFLDDAARLGERVVARRWRKLRPDFDFRLDKSGSKGTLIGRRRPL